MINGYPWSRWDECGNVTGVASSLSIWNFRTSLLYGPPSVPAVTTVYAWEGEELNAAIEVPPVAADMVML